MQKDMLLALELGVPLPATATANEYLSAARGLGLAEQDFATASKVKASVMARMSGVAQ